MSDQPTQETTAEVEAEPEVETETWDKLPLELMDKLAEKETYRRDVYRPIYSLHKWWARRPGSTFRSLGLAALTDETITKEDILSELHDGSHEGLYLDSYDQQINPDDIHIDRDVSVLDPFAGGGTTLVELNRLGADVTGYELNPVAWWTEKKSMDDVNLDVLEREFDQILEEVRDELGEYYTTVDPETDQECEVLYYFQSQRLPCLTCDEEVQLFPRYQLAKTKKTRPGVLYCPNRDCSNRIIELEDRSKGLDEGTDVSVINGGTVTVSMDGNEVCSNCGHEFDPNDGTYGYGKYTCSNGHKHDVKETLQRRDERPTFERFALQYIDPRGSKRIKEFDENDAKRVEQVQERFEKLQAELPIPEQRIPSGDKTDALRNYNYERFSELFTNRHLLTFGLLFEKARNVRHRKFDNADAQNVAEFLVTALSNNLIRIGNLCVWDVYTAKTDQVFKRHAYIPRVQPVESNPLNHDKNVASLNNAFRKVYRGKEFCKRPFEKVKNSQSGDVEQFPVASEEISEQQVAALNCKTAEQMDENDESFDYIITDPPYYDNVQYSELSDYFYIWLRECLHEEHDEFEPELVPKAREIVANTTANKDEEFFVESLTNVFSECHRVLKPDGEMVFTYHHNENEAWSVILEALIRSGFTVTGAYPVQSEMPNNPHISELDNAEYDILIFANKDDADEAITLSELEQELFFDLDDIISDEQERHQNLSRADLGVILRGKCMYYYSRYYPNITADGEHVSVTEALEAVDDLIEQSLQGAALVPQSLDASTEAYAAFVRRESEDYSTLNKNLLAKNLSVADLEDEHLVDGPREEKRPVPAEERVYHIEQKLNGNGAESTNGGGTLLAIDKLHYLYHLYITDQNAVEYLREWTSDDLEDLAEFMADETGDERYERALETSLSQF
jgi:putative DNA methylase